MGEIRIAEKIRCKSFNQNNADEINQNQAFDQISRGF